MLQKVVAGYTTPVSKFKVNPGALLKEAQGEPIAITSNNRVEFYAVPAELFEAMTAFCEFAQSGTTDMKPTTARAHLEGVDLERLARDAAKRIKKAKDDQREEPWR